MPVSSLDYETTLTRVARLAVPQIADWCNVHLAGEDGAIRELAVARVDPARLAQARDLLRRYPPKPGDPRRVPNVPRTGQSEIYPSRVDAGRLTLERRVTDITSLVQGVVAMAQAGTSRYSITLRAPALVPH